MDSKAKWSKLVDKFVDNTGEEDIILFLKTLELRTDGDTRTLKDRLRNRMMEISQETDFTECEEDAQEAKERRDRLLAKFCEDLALVSSTSSGTESDNSKKQDNRQKKLSKTRKRVKRKSELSEEVANFNDDLVTELDRDNTKMEDRVDIGFTRITLPKGESIDIPDSSLEYWKRHQEGAQRRIALKQAMLKQDYSEDARRMENYMQNEQYRRNISLPSLHLQQHQYTDTENIVDDRNVTRRSRMERNNAYVNTHAASSHPTVQRPATYAQSALAAPVYMERAPRDISKIIAAWKVQFSGKGKENIDEFLMRVDELSQVALLSDSELLRAIPMLLSKPALNLYRVKKDEWKSWSDVKQDLIKQYRDSMYAQKLQDEARARMQGAEEPVYDYITSMQLIFSRMPSKLTQQEQVDRLYTNMRAEYHPLLHPYKCLGLQAFIGQAVNLGRAFEVGKSTPRLPPTEENLVPDAHNTEKASKKANVAAIKMQDDSKINKLMEELNKIKESVQKLSVKETEEKKNSKGWENRQQGNYRNNRREFYNNRSPPRGQNHNSNRYNAESGNRNYGQRSSYRSNRRYDNNRSGNYRPHKNYNNQSPNRNRYSNNKQNQSDGSPQRNQNAPRREWHASNRFSGYTPRNEGGEDNTHKTAEN